MGKKPVLGIVSALCVGLALTGCRNCSSCQSDGTTTAKANPAAFKPQPTFQTNTAAASPSSSPQGWNNSGTLPKPTNTASADAPASSAMDKSQSKPTEPLATSKPALPDVQPAAFTPPPAPPAPTSAATPVDANTSHFPPQTTGRILPSPPALATGSSLPPLPDERPFPPKAEDSTTLPPPPPPPPSIPHSLSSDATPLPAGTLPPPAPPAPSLAPGMLPPPPAPPAPPGPNG